MRVLNFTLVPLSENQEEMRHLKISSFASVSLPSEKECWPTQFCLDNQEITNDNLEINSLLISYATMSGLPLFGSN